MNRILSALGASVVLSIVACTAAQEEAPVGESNDSVTSATQLNGSSMAPGSYALTFDDGPGGRTEELANWLGDRGIVATFFINGKNAPGREAALEAIRSRGHLLANHTHNHENMRGLSGGALYSAVADTDAIIARYQPNGPWLLRAPYGAWDARVSNDLNATDMNKYVGSIFWNVGGQLTATAGADWACWSQGVDVGDCAGRYMNEMRTRGRGIVLMHDTNGKTVEMTKMIVEQMSAEGARFVPITDAPSIAEALGNAPPPPPAPPPPAPPAGCGDLDYIGRCEGATLVWCENDVRKSKDCSSNGRRCVWQDDRVGWNCMP